MSEQMPSRSTPELDKPMSEYSDSDAALLAVRAIDQAVADWKTDAPEVAVPHNWLIRSTFYGDRLHRIAFKAYRAALTTDERFLRPTQIDNTPHYNYVPVLSEGSLARASLSALVLGRGIYTEQERQGSLSFLQQEADVLLRTLQDHGRHHLNLPFRKISGMLRAQLGRDLTREELSGFKTFMQQDERFGFKENGDVSLTFKSPTALREDDLSEKLRAIGLSGGGRSRRSTSSRVS